ncbi:DEAD/DEAH box helicase [Streptomyces rubiginosohelvolus]|uniref:DEAD/DEAH box helicase n=1 Tax=Streptomyces rubiginosohelvolus TaxID=67362 RepID=UPI0035D78A3E
MNERSHRSLITSALEPVLAEGFTVEPSASEAEEGEAKFAAQSLDLLAWDAIMADPKSDEARRLCRQAFSVARAQVETGPSEKARLFLLRTACLGWLSDETPLAARLLAEAKLPRPVPSSAGWEERVVNGLIDVWLLLLRKRGWDDLDSLGQVISALRRDQEHFESEFLTTEGGDSRPAAWELVCYYHAIRAGEIVAEFLATGSVLTEVRGDRRFDVRERVETHFDRALDAAIKSGNVDLEEMSRLLGVTAGQLIDNSLWTVSRAVSPEVTAFVESLISRGAERPLFEALPPQRAALAEQGLIRSAFRSVVVSLPTSAGKTLIAQFRILQALSTYRQQGGWVAYVAPNRALVNQITRRLRRDLGPLGVNVERVSPALEVDGLEGEMLKNSTESRFDVLVTTPEKLDLLLRSGWQESISRPLCLAVVDEAHNISDPTRGIKLELLLAGINREARDAAFLLLTPFINNGETVAKWLDGTSQQSIKMSLDWTPNDRLIALACHQPGSRGNYSINLRPLVTSKNTLSVNANLPIGYNRPLGFSSSAAKSQGKLAAATASVLAARGQTITLAQRPDYAWTIAQQIGSGREARENLHPAHQSVIRVVAEEFGSDFPLVDLLRRGIGVHHRGLPDDVRTLTEYLMETGDLGHLVSTTTIAQGVNFPVANVVLASHQFPYGQDMPAPDFWNLAGRAGRIEQGQVGIVALAAGDEEKAQKLRTFVDRNVADLNSTLVTMVQEAISQYGALNLHQLSYQPTWSSFVQFLAHTYRQIGDHAEFASEVEQILRGTLGFQDLRSHSPAWAAELTRGVRDYAERITGKPLSLVDSTGFSWESVSAALGRLSDSRIDAEIWEEPLYGASARPLSGLVGVMLEVPELRESLLPIITDYESRSGDFIAHVIRDWVNGASIPDLASTYFKRDGDSDLTAVTKCCQRLFGQMAPTVAWGLSALQSMTIGERFNDLTEDRQRELRNVPSYAFYGVASEQEISMRLLGVPRSAAPRMAVSVLGGRDASLGEARRRLAGTTEATWRAALGSSGSSYFQVWKILDGVN